MPLLMHLKAGLLVVSVCLYGNAYKAGIGTGLHLLVRVFVRSPLAGAKSLSPLEAAESWDL
jgi:hypothetical protein